MSVGRFDLGPHQMTPSSEGAYVRYEDYAKLEKALEQAIAVTGLSMTENLNYQDSLYWGLCPASHNVTVQPPMALAAYLRELEDKR